MKRNAVGLLAAMTMVAAGCGATAESESGAPAESIAVHGDWTIEIYNEDGTLDEHVEFSNALVGGVDLVDVLSRDLLHEGWLVSWGSRSGTSPCNAGLPGVQGCAYGGDWITVGPNLTTNGDQLTLSGSADATQDGVIDYVASQLVLCPTTGCGGIPPAIGFREFTAKDVVDPGTGSPYEIAAGQSMQVKVTLSFTTG